MSDVTTMLAIRARAKGFKTFSITADFEAGSPFLSSWTWRAEHRNGTAYGNAFDFTNINAPGVTTPTLAFVDCAKDARDFLETFKEDPAKL